jgi:hypothetical protein
MAYAIGVIIIFYCLIRIFIYVTRKDWKFNDLFIFFLIALACDILSTFYFVYILGLGWSKEANYLIGKYGYTFGHLNVLFFNHFLIATGGYIFGFLLNKLGSLYSIFFYLSFSIITFGVVLQNIIFPTIDVLFE